MPRTGLATISILAALLLSACGGGAKVDRQKAPSPSVQAVGACGGASPTAEIVAAKSQFDKKCVAATAGKPLKLTFRNDDTYQHNFAVTKGKGGEKLYTSPFFDGSAKSTAEVPALDAGTYYFECNIHPFVMNGEYRVS